jgi:hypothetical protein
MDFSEANLSPYGWNEVAVAESFCSTFGFVDIETNGSLIALIGVVADLAVEYGLISFESSGENAVNLVSGVPSIDDSPPPWEEYGEALFRVILLE